jgi:uncharacterized protein YndB with AHSA1/START domain
MSNLKFSAFFIGLAVAILTPVLARADVADSAANGFTVKLAVTIQAPPQDVYRRLVHNVGDWWDPMHTFSGDAHNLSIDDKPMGCFCEKLPSGGGVRHLEVVYADPGKRLVLSGGLGPLQSMAVTGSMTVQRDAASEGTKLAEVYTGTGYLPAGMNTWAAPVDSVLTQQFTRLKAFVENGKAAAQNSEVLTEPRP